MAVVFQPDTVNQSPGALAVSGFQYVLGNVASTVARDGATAQTVNGASGYWVTPTTAED